MDVKWFVIGIIVGFVLSIIILIIIGLNFPFTSTEEICFAQTTTSEDYEECLRTFVDNG